MPTTVGGMEDKLSQLREREWATFLGDLYPWERHRLLRGELELLLHDAYLEGDLTLQDARLTLSFDESVVEVGDPRD